MKFQALLKANGGKRPKDYKGAAELELASKRTQVKGLEEVDMRSESEGSELDCEGLTVPGFGLQVKQTATNGAPCKPPARVPTENSFSALREESTSLEGWAHKVVVASQKLGQTSQRDKTFTVRTEEDVDAAVKMFEQRKTSVAGILERATLSSRVKVCGNQQLADDEMWVMVDSGSGAHCINVGKMLPRHLIQESPGQLKGQVMETAGGHELQNEGQVLVDFETQEGIRSNIVFQNVKVTTPILSVRKLVLKGHKVEFWDGGGCITGAGAGGHKMFFVERNGVYYIKLRILPPKNNEAGFTRRG